MKPHDILAAFTLCIYLNICYGQQKEFVIKDNETKDGVPFAYVKIHQNGTIIETLSNQDGKILIPGPYDSIEIRHLAYDLCHIKRIDDSKTIFLKPSVTTLNTVTIYYIDLKKRIAFVLDHFSQLYVTRRQTYECTYKETCQINDELTRVLQVNIYWQDENYESNLKEDPPSQNKLFLVSTSFAKTRNDSTFQRRALTNKSLLAALHLNNFLSAIHTYSKDFSILSVEKSNFTIKIVFNVELEKNGSSLGCFEDSYLVFDARKGAILELYSNFINKKNNTVLPNQERTSLGASSIRETRKMTFIQDDEKLRLNYFEIENTTSINSKNKTANIKNNVSFYVTQRRKTKKIEGSQHLELTEKPLYEQIRNTPIHSPTIPPTEKETRFLNKDE